ncbi:MAG: hypothetical protein FWB73_04925 [Treponema sp.]|nr:hypothetical protein [Treponema sp.]
MKKSLVSKIIGLAAIYCVVFCVFAILQFSGKGSFNLSAGGMSIRGRYLSETPVRSEEGMLNAQLAGPIKIFYEGLEINLKEDRNRGLILTGADGAFTVNPDSMILTENSARFIMPGGISLTFNSLNSARGIELQISAELPENISEMTIPIIPRRSSLVRDNDQIGILYSGSRYFLTSTGKEFEEEKITLSKDNTFISYRQRGKQRIFDPADYIIADAGNYENVIRNRYASAFAYWSQNASLLQNEDDIIALLSGSIQRGNYSSSLYAVSPRILDSAEHSYRSSVYVGGMNNAYRTFSAAENEKINTIMRSTREKSLAFLKEEHVINYLFSRSINMLAYEVIDVLNNAEPHTLTIEQCAGLLEVFADYRRWRPVNTIEHLTEQMLHVISDHLNRSVENDTVSVFVSIPDGNNTEYSLRLGKSLAEWAMLTQHHEWELIGKSLVLSSLANSNSGKLYNALNLTNYIPKEFWITDNGLWAWTISTGIRAAYINTNLNLSFTFMPNMTQYIILRGVSPFLRIQIHGMDWRTDSQFERYESSGWVYYASEQTLVLKIRHRSTTENVRLIYREEAPPPPPPPVTEGENVE